MRHLPRRIGIVVTTVVALGVALAPSVSAADEISESMCGLFSKKEVRAALDQKRQQPDPDLDAYACYWSSPEFNDPQRELIVSWTDRPTTLDEVKTQLADTNVGSGAVDLILGTRPALYTGGPGLGTLHLQLDQGVLVLTMRDLQGTDWQSAIAGLGELAATRGDQLVPLPPVDEALMAMFPATLAGAPVVTQPSYPAKQFQRESRKALNKRLKAQDKKFADVSMAFGGPITALRVAGADASAFMEDLILSMGLGGAYTIEPEKVPNGTVGVVRGPNDYVFFVYPKDDVAWGVAAEEPLLTEAFASLPGAPVPPVLPEPTPAPTPDISTPEGYLLSLLPATVGGEEVVSVVYMGKEALTADSQKAFRATLKDQGKTMDDVSIAAAYTPNGTQIQGFRIAGGDAAPLEPVLLKFMKDTGQVDKKATPTPAQVAAKAVSRVKTSAGDAYLYPKDDVLWLVMAANEADLTEVFTALP
jgi:hypothetical protein